MEIRVGTFNILNTCVNYPMRKNYIEKTIEEMDCDVLGIQEVNFEGNTELKDLEKYKTEYIILPFPMFLPVPDFRIDGNALLVKKNIRVLEKFDLFYSGKQRAAQFLKLEKAGKEFIVMNTHLDHTSDDIRTEQVKELIDFSKNFGGFPMFCTGDYNFTPTSIPYSLMSQEFTSVYLETNGKEPEITYPTPLEGVFPLPQDFRCIDYIWTRGEIIKKRSSLIKTCGIGTQYASDHYPLTADFEIPI